MKPRDPSIALAPTTPPQLATLEARTSASVDGKEVVVSAPAVFGEAAAARTPAIVARSGTKAIKRFFEFFTAHIENNRSRDAYCRARLDFFPWCEDHGVEVIDIEPIVVAAYIEYVGTGYSKPTKKQGCRGQDSLQSGHMIKVL